MLNLKPGLMERISRCTGGQIMPPGDPLVAPKIGHCEAFHVERFVEEHGSAGQEGRKGTKTLMYFEGCLKPLGCTVSGYSYVVVSGNLLALCEVVAVGTAVWHVGR